MKILPILALNALTCAGLTLGLAKEVAAHGGRYRGPEDIVPPDTKPHPTGNQPGPTTGGTGQPKPPGPMTPGGLPPGPATGRPTTPIGGPPGARPGGRTGGYALVEDFGRWEYWWEFNKDPFLRLKDSLYRELPETGSPEFFMGPWRRVASRSTTKPSESDVVDRILPPLRRAMESARNSDITTACLIAMAKVGEKKGSFAFLPLFRERLSYRNQEIRETAALALGIAQTRAAEKLLTALASDTPAGRSAVQSTQVDDRTRSFAIYGLALLANAHADPDLKRRVFDVCANILDEGRIADRNISVAAVLGIRLLRLNARSVSPKHERLRADAIDALDRFYDRDLGRAAELVQSHVPTAIARILGRGATPQHQAFKQKFVQALAKTRRGKRSYDVHRAAVLALGQMALPAESHEDDAVISTALRRYHESGRDAQSRSFALIALAQIGGMANRLFLLNTLKLGRKMMVKPWAAIALGTMAFRSYESEKKVDDTIGAALLQNLKQATTPYARSAMAVALGLSRYRPAGEHLRKLLETQAHQDELAGYLCIGLALMDYHAAKPRIEQLLRNSVRRPKRLRQAATALGKLGDRRVTGLLLEKLSDPDQNLAKCSAIASALAFIGDRHSISPLTRLLEDDGNPALTRAFAAAALGGIADKEKLPWNSKIARHLNYRGSVETLTQSGSGILDIL